MKSLFLLLFSLTAYWSTASAQTAPDPKLKPNDIVQMEVFGEADMTTQTRVLKSGEVVFPLIGTVKVGGLTLAQAIEAVRTLYAEKYFVDPKVTITINEYASEFVYVVGEVNRAGQIPIPASGKLDLATAIAGAGGLSQLADRNQIVLTRGESSTSTYTAQRIERGAPINLKPGDRVIVHQSRYVNKTVTILGQVRKPGPLPMPLDGRLDIVAAIARAGGFTPMANPKKVSVNRGGKVVRLNLREMTEKGDRRYYLQPEDIVTVAERFF